MTTKEVKLEDIINRIKDISESDYTNASKSRRFKPLYKYLLAKYLYGSQFHIIGFKTSKAYITTYIQDEYTGRKLYLMVPDITVDKNAWFDTIEYRTVESEFCMPTSYRNYCKLPELISSLNNLNVFYNKGIDIIRLAGF